MFSTLLERMIKVGVPDRDDPSKIVELNRYVIDKKEKPTAVLFGKFIPFTGPRGHGRLVEFAKKHFDEVVIVSPTRKKSFDPNVDIFTDDQKQEIIEKATGLKFIRVDSSIPIRMFTRVIQEGIERPVLIVGPDRIKEFSKYFIEYDPDNPSIEDPKHPDFGKGEYFFLDSRGNEETSGTKVRKTLLDGNKEEFLRLTGYDDDMWKLMRGMLDMSESGIIRFDNFYYLTEGGNVTIKGIPADKIPMDKINAKQFAEIQQEIVGALKALNKEFEDKYGKPLFPKIDENIKNGKLFSGSTRPFFAMKFDDFVKHKKAVGDMDLQYPEEMRKQLQEFLKNNEGKKFGKMTFLGAGGNSPTQENTIFQSTVAPDLVKNIQVDFEPTFFEDGVPNEFSTFAHYSSWKDIQNRVKGAFSKLLMRALVSAKERLGDIAVQTPTGKISTSSKYSNPSLRKFSVDKGMRVAFEPVLDDKGNQEKSPDGKPLYREIDTKNSTYERDVDDIMSFVFGKKLSSKEIKDAYSFIGLLNLMKKYLDKDDVKMIFSSFMDIIWKTGQEITMSNEFDENDIQVDDYETKKAAYEQFVKVFPELKMNDDELIEFVKPFYKSLMQNKIKKGQKINKIKSKGK